MDSGLPIRRPPAVPLNNLDKLVCNDPVCLFGRMQLIKPQILLWVWLALALGPLFAVVDIARHIPDLRIIRGVIVNIGQLWTVSFPLPGGIFSVDQTRRSHTNPYISITAKLAPG